MWLLGRSFLVWLALVDSGVRSRASSRTFEACFTTASSKGLSEGSSGLQANGGGLESTSCVPPGTSSCFHIEHFGISDYAGNGVYCSLGDSKEVAKKGVAPKHYIRVAKVNVLRYEVILTSQHEASGEDSGQVVYSWTILRVTKSTNSKGQWVGLPIYQAKSSSPDMPLSGWTAVKVRNDSYAYDHNEPTLIISAAELSDAHLGYLWGYKEAEGKGGDDLSLKVCIAESCNTSGDADVPSTCSGGKLGRHEIEASAHLAELGYSNELAASKYGDLLKCALEETADRKLVPRFSRWEIANAYDNVGRMKAKQGLLSEALLDVIQSLSYSPVEAQRRELYTDLGDLYVAKGEVESAVEAYKKAKNAVRTEGGTVSKAGFSVRTNKASLGGALVEVLGEHYVAVRNMIVLGMDEGKEWEDAVSRWKADVGLGTVEKLVCKEGEIMMGDGIEAGAGKKFCKKYQRHTYVNDNSAASEIDNSITSNEL